MSEGRGSKGNLTVLQVQLSTAREELNILKQEDKEFLSLSSIRARMCTFCHVAGHTKTTNIQNTEQIYKSYSPR